MTRFAFLNCAVLACVLSGACSGPATWSHGPDHVTERGKYLNVWIPVDGNWKIKANMWNTSAPPSTPK